MEKQVKDKAWLPLTREDIALSNLHKLGKRVVESYDSRHKSNELKYQRSRFRFFHCEAHGLLPIGMFVISLYGDLWRVKKKCIVCHNLYHQDYRKTHHSKIKGYNKKHYWKYHTEELERQSKRREEDKKNLTDRYIKQLYASKGIPAEQVTQKLIDRKRAEIILLREKKEKSSTI